jgi:hypothetical protein
VGRKVNANAPGLKCKRNKDGTFRWYWEANRAAVKRGYQPAVVRLFYDDTA